MPTLKQLVDGLSWSEVLDTLTLRTQEPRHLIFYENIFKKLRFLEPRQSDTRILATYTQCEDGDYIHICGLSREIDLDTSQETQWDLSFTTWEEWLGMEIEPQSIADFRAADIVAACLHDMSWEGRSQTIIRKRGNELIRKIRQGRNELCPLVFISHASEDKDSVARPLATELRKLGVEVWFDESELIVGDSLRARIADGISRADYSIVILSKNFFRKKWTQHELSGLVSLELSGGGSILPLWHGVTASEVIMYDPSLADKIALSTTSLSIEAIALKVEEAIYIKRNAREREVD